MGLRVETFCSGTHLFPLYNCELSGDKGIENAQTDRQTQTGNYKRPLLYLDPKNGDKRTQSNYEKGGWVHILFGLSALSE